MTIHIRNFAFVTTSMLAAGSALATPPPTDVKMSGLLGIDAKHGQFNLEWTPARSPAGKTYTDYVLSNWCVYRGVGGGKSVPGPGTYIYTGPPYKVVAMCDCKYGTPQFNIITAKPADEPYAGRSKMVPIAPRFQVPCG